MAQAQVEKSGNAKEKGSHEPLGASTMLKVIFHIDEMAKADIPLANISNTLENPGRDNVRVELLAYSEGVRKTRDAARAIIEGIGGTGDCLQCPCKCAQGNRIFQRISARFHDSCPCRCCRAHQKAGRGLFLYQIPTDNSVILIIHAMFYIKKMHIITRSEKMKYTTTPLVLVK